MLKDKIGPARKLAMLVDEIKARQFMSEPECSSGKPDKEHQYNIQISATSSIVINAESVGGAENIICGSASDTNGEIKCFIPKYSPAVQNLLENGEILKEWDHFIEETAYHILSAPQKFDAKDQYNELGRLLVQKYPCIKFQSGHSPWSFFTKKLSQKIRNIRWKWNRRSEKESVNGGQEKKKKKGPREFVRFQNKDDDGIDKNKDGKNTMASVKKMEDELLKVEKDQDKALIKRLLKETLDSRRGFIKSLDDGNMRTITSKYPALKKAIFIQWEFFMLKASVTTESLAEKWTEFLHRIDVVLGHKEDTETEEIEHEDAEILIALQKVQQKIRFISKSKKEFDLITEMEAKDVNLQSRAKSAPRLVILKNDKSIVNNCFVVGDGLSIEAGPNVKNAIQLLLMCYYVFDLAYPKMYQLLGLLQVHLFGDDAPFIKSSNYIKFEKTFLEQL